jgi:hypothetical protein
MAEQTTNPMEIAERALNEWALTRLGLSGQDVHCLAHFEGYVPRELSPMPEEYKRIVGGVEAVNDPSESTTDLQLAITAFDPIAETADTTYYTVPNASIANSGAMTPTHVDTLDTVVQGLADEIDRATAAEQVNAEAINNESAAARAAEQANEDAIIAEAATRAAADTDIWSLIPPSASTSNSLATIAFVNSSIENMSANRVRFDSTSNDFPTKADLTEAIATGTFYFQGAAYTPKKNDYAGVLADEDYGHAPTRYVFDGVDWGIQSVINNSGFTQEQMDALDSGITADALEVLQSAVNTNLPAEISDHTGNTTVHITSAERTSWNAMIDQLPEVVQDAGTSTTAVISQKGVTDLLANAGSGGASQSVPPGMLVRKVQEEGIDYTATTTDNIRETFYPVRSCEANFPGDTIPIGYVDLIQSSDLYSPQPIADWADTVTVTFAQIGADTNVTLPIDTIQSMQYYEGNYQEASMLMTYTATNGNIFEFQVSCYLYLDRPSDTYVQIRFSDFQPGSGPATPGPVIAASVQWQTEDWTETRYYGPLVTLELTETMTVLDTFDVRMAIPFAEGLLPLPILFDLDFQAAAGTHSLALVVVPPELPEMIEAQGILLRAIVIADEVDGNLVLRIDMATMTGEILPLGIFGQAQITRLVRTGPGGGDSNE